jgi:hypothetical protein
MLENMAVNFPTFLYFLRNVSRHRRRAAFHRMPVVPILILLCFSIPNAPIHWSVAASPKWIIADVPSARHLMIGVDVPYSEEATPWPLFSEEVVEEEDDAATAFLHCTLISPCTACTDTDRADLAECAATGRIETLRCLRAEDHAPYARRRRLEDASSPPQWSIAYRACARTQTEQEFLFLQFQVLCGLLGGLAVYSIRQQKRTVATLFDQRRLNAANARRAAQRSGNANPAEGIELKTTTTRSSSNPTVLRQASSVHGNNEEMKSLLSSSNPMNVV